MSCWRTTLAILALSASITIAEDITTVKGKVYRNATISRVEPDGIVLRTKSGISKVYFTELPKDVQERFHHAPKTANVYSKQGAARTSDVRHDDTAMVDAAKNADAFLAALKILELPEGKQAEADTSWLVNMEQLPVLLEQEKLSDSVFPTDVAGVDGYRRLIQAKVQSEGDTQLTEKYLIVSYRDQRTGKWKVWGFRKISGIDVEYEINAARTNLSDTAYVSAQGNYWRYAYWLELGGRILAARQALETALATDRRSHDQYFQQEHCQNELTAIQAICGQ